jgi:hypothetical protein
MSIPEVTYFRRAAKDVKVGRTMSLKKQIVASKETCSVMV